MVIDAVNDHRNLDKLWNHRGLEKSNSNKIDMINLEQNSARDNFCKSNYEKSNLNLACGQTLCPCIGKYQIDLT